MGHIGRFNAAGSGDFNIMKSAGSHIGQINGQPFDDPAPRFDRMSPMSWQSPPPPPSQHFVNRGFADRVDVFATPKASGIFVNGKPSFQQPGQPFGFPPPSYFQQQQEQLNSFFGNMQKMFSHIF